MTGRVDIAKELKYTEVGRILNHIIICAKRTKESKLLTGLKTEGFHIHGRFLPPLINS